MQLVAEGVETEEQRPSLQALGCALAQGFLYYAAGSFEETTQRLLTNAQGRSCTRTKKKARACGPSSQARRCADLAARESPAQ